MKDNKGYPLCTLFGFQFYVAQQSADVMSHEVLVPAWAVRSVNKADQAHFLLCNLDHKLMMYICKSDKLPTLLDVNLTLIPGNVSDEDAAAMASQDASLQAFCPLAIGRLSVAITGSHADFQ